MTLAYHGVCLQENSLLKNTYKIKKVISQSQLSVVYIGENVETGKVHVIKEFFPKELALRDLDQVSVLSRLPSTRKKYEKLKNLFLNEADLLKRLTHEYIVAYCDHFEEHGTAYIVMEYCEGKTMQQYIKECQEENPSSAVYKILCALINALNYIHKQGIIHRDIKPSNIMIDLKGNPRILDFGSAIDRTKEEKPMIFTTNGYSPLEFYSGNSKQGAYSDIYSLSAVLYFALSGKVPKDISTRIIEDRLKSVRKYNPKISPILSTTITWGLAVQPKNRCFSLKFLRYAILLELLVGKIRGTFQ